MKNEENDEILDALFDIIYAEIKNIKNEKHRETIRKTLKKIKGKEENSEKELMGKLVKGIYIKIFIL